MVASEISDAPLRRGRPIIWIIGLAALAVPLILILPALQYARDSARQMSSGHNLKQIALGIHNYHEVHSCLPAGGIFREDGVGMRGWPTIIIPFLEQATIGGQGLDEEAPWDDPKQVGHFMMYRFKTYLAPGVAEQATVDGLPVIHYAANERLLYRNSAVTLAEIPDHRNTLLVAESFGSFPPYADVYNWRDPTIPFRTSPQQFGSTIRKTTLAVLVDGSVESFGPTLDELKLMRLAAQELVRPSPELVERPSEPYRLKTQEIVRFLCCSTGGPPRSKGGNIVMFTLSPNSQNLTADFDSREPLSDPETGKWRSKFEPFVKSRPIEHVQVSGTLAAQELEPFLAIPTLKRLTLRSAEVYGDKDAVLRKARKSIEID